MKQRLFSTRVSADSFVAVRDRTRAVGELFGLDKLDCTRFIAAVSEIIRSTVHGDGEGSITFWCDLGGPFEPDQYVLAEILEQHSGTPAPPGDFAGRKGDRVQPGEALASARRLADQFRAEPAAGGGTLVTVGMARSRGAPRLTAEDLAVLMDQLVRRKARSPVEELEQQNREMVLALQELRERKAELEIADERKNQFVATLAHELRNPLNTLQMTLHILRHKNAFESPDLMKHHAVMTRQAEQLNLLVNDLLDVARVSQGKVDLHLRPTDLNELVCQALEMTGAAIKAKEHHVDLSTSAEPLWVNADSTRMKQVLSNLMHNAARYTNEQGRIMVTVRRAESNATVEVADDGIGMAADLLPHVFGLFVQGGQQAGGAPAGLGVGLTLAQRLVHEHGGTVSAASAGRGRGSQFTVTLPLCTGPPATHAAS